MVTPVKSPRLTPSTSSQGSLLLERSCSTSTSTDNEEQGAGCLSSSQSSSGSSSDCYSSRVIWVAGINGGPANDAHGLKHVFQQIVGPGDHIFALFLFDHIPSESRDLLACALRGPSDLMVCCNMNPPKQLQASSSLKLLVGITFSFTPDGFRSTEVKKLLRWLSQKLNFWREYLQPMVAHCREENVTLELRVCAGHSLGETAVREAQFLQATDIIVERNEGHNSPAKKVAKLLSEKTEARVGLIQRRQASNHVEAVIQVPENCQPHNFSSHALMVNPDKQALVSDMLKGLPVICQESEDPYYISLSMALFSSTVT